MGHAILERVLLFGTRSADYIRASGHNGCIATEVILALPLLSRAGGPRKPVGFGDAFGRLGRSAVPCLASGRASGRLCWGRG